MTTRRRSLQLIPHPRLYVGADDIARLREEPKLPFLRKAAEEVTADAARFARMPPLTCPRGSHNEHLVRAREMQIRIVTLLARWGQTGQERFRRAVLGYVSEMGEWEHWSWGASLRGDRNFDCEFDLSYGENSATLAVAYDWLHGSLSAGERRVFVGIARERAFKSAIKNVRRGGSWWFANPSINWNSVCAGGLGMLALAMLEDAPEAAMVLPRCEESITPFMKYLETTAGAWPEGICYWQYGMRYAFMYLLSHERATGRVHPLMRLKGVRQTLSFPLDFYQHGHPCSFGDCNAWQAQPIHYAAARRLGCPGVLQALDAELERTAALPGKISRDWPHAPEWLALHPGRASKPTHGAKGGGAKVYRGLDWGIIADTMPLPNLYVAVRGGTTNGWEYWALLNEHGNPIALAVLRAQLGQPRPPQEDESSEV